PHDSSRSVPGSPATVVDVVEPAAVEDVVEPATVVDVVEPATVDDVVAPGAVDDVVAPATVVEVVDDELVVVVAPSAGGGKVESTGRNRSSAVWPTSSSARCAFFTPGI